MYKPHWQSLIILTAFFFNTIGIVPLSQANEFYLPTPGIMLHPSPKFNPSILKGIKVLSENPFRFDFILDKGDGVIASKAKQSNQEQLRQDAKRLIKYFLATLTIPEKDLWVNLSPYEKNRIIPESFGKTEMGRDLLAEDYMLKQITASLIYPEGAIGRKFWARVYEEAAKKFGTTNIPVNTFNKVWIVPDKAIVYENAKAGTAYVVEARLKVMLEEDYLSLSKHDRRGRPGVGPLYRRTQGSPLRSFEIIREIIIPQLNKEVNQGANFAQLRQVYNSLILAAWYKKKIKDSILAQVYEDKNKVEGILSSPNALVGDPKHIYQQYLQAFKKGVYNYIKEEYDPNVQEKVPRKYFSGGVDIAPYLDKAMNISSDAAQLPEDGGGGVVVEVGLYSSGAFAQSEGYSRNMAMTAADIEAKIQQMHLFLEKLDVLIQSLLHHDERVRFQTAEILADLFKAGLVKRENIPIKAFMELLTIKVVEKKYEHQMGTYEVDAKTLAVLLKAGLMAQKDIPRAYRNSISNWAESIKEKIDQKKSSWERDLKAVTGFMSIGIIEKKYISDGLEQKIVDYVMDGANKQEVWELLMSWFQDKLLSNESVERLFNLVLHLIVKNIKEEASNSKLVRSKRWELYEERVEPSKSIAQHDLLRYLNILLDSGVIQPGNVDHKILGEIEKNIENKDYSDFAVRLIERGIIPNTPLLQQKLREIVADTKGGVKEWFSSYWSLGIQHYLKVLKTNDVPQEVLIYLEGLNFTEGPNVEKHSSYTEKNVITQLVKSGFIQRHDKLWHQYRNIMSSNLSHIGNDPSILDEFIKDVRKGIFKKEDFPEIDWQKLGHFIARGNFMGYRFAELADLGLIQEKDLPEDLAGVLADDLFNKDIGLRLRAAQNIRIAYESGFLNPQSMALTNLDDLFLNMDRLQLPRETKIKLAEVYWEQPLKTSISKIWINRLKSLFEALDDADLTTANIQRLVAMAQNNDPQTIRKWIINWFTSGKAAEALKLLSISFQNGSNAVTNFPEIMRSVFGLYLPTLISKPAGLPSRGRQARVGDFNSLQLDTSAVPLSYGRTMVYVMPGGKSVHLKFLKRGESADDLVYEYDMMNFFNKVLKSWGLTGKYPKGKAALISVSEDQVRGLTRFFESKGEKVELFVDEHGKYRCMVYETQARADGINEYLTYLNDPALSHEQFMEGLRINTHDRMVMAAHGLFDKEIIELFHNIQGSRRYNWMVDMWGKQREGAGRLDNLTAATLYPNIRLSGPADFAGVYFIDDLLKDRNMSGFADGRISDIMSMVNHDISRAKAYVTAAFMGDILMSMAYMPATYLFRRKAAALDSFEYSIEAAEQRTFFQTALANIFQWGMESYNADNKSIDVHAVGIDFQQMAAQMAYSMTDQLAHDFRQGQDVPQTLFKGTEIGKVVAGEGFDEEHGWNYNQSEGVYDIPSIDHRLKLSLPGLDTGPMNGATFHQELVRALYFFTTLIIFNGTPRTMRDDRAMIIKSDVASQAEAIKAGLVKSVDADEVTPGTAAFNGWYTAFYQHIRGRLEFLRSKFETSYSFEDFSVLDWMSLRENDDHFNFLSLYLNQFQNKNIPAIIDKIRQAKKEGRKIILELGSGNTQNALKLAEENEDALVIATDFYNLEHKNQIPKYVEYAVSFQRNQLPAQRAMTKGRDNLIVLRSTSDILLYMPDASIDSIVLVHPVRAILNNLAVLFREREFNIFRKLTPTAEMAVLAPLSVQPYLHLMGIGFNFETRIDSTEYQYQDQGKGVDLGANSDWQNIGYLKGFLYVGKLLPSRHPKAEERIDKAQVINGGIDFNTDKMNLQVKIGSPTRASGDDMGMVADEKGIRFHISPDMLRQLENSPGFDPVIIDFKPLTSLRRFLEIV